MRNDALNVFRCIADRCGSKLDALALRQVNQEILNKNSLHIRDGSVFRTSEVEIRGSRHLPPSPDQIEMQTSLMLDKFNSEFEISPSLSIAYLFWRINWIHPFFDGNGRTARAIAFYLMEITSHRWNLLGDFEINILRAYKDHLRALSELDSLELSDDLVLFASLSQILSDCRRSIGHPILSE